MKTWVAAVVAGGLPVAGGVGGYFIGAVGDHHHGRDAGRYVEQGHGWPGPGFRDGPRRGR